MYAADRWVAMAGGGGAEKKKQATAGLRAMIVKRKV